MLRGAWVIAVGWLFWGNLTLAAPPQKKTVATKKTAATKAAGKKSVKSEKAAPAKGGAASAVQDLNANERSPVSKGSNSEVEEVQADVGDVRHYPYKLNSGIGVDVIAGLGSAFHVKAQFGYALWEGVPFYLGPEVGFSLFSPGSILSTAAAVWYELRIYGAPRLSMSLGLGVGPVFPSSTTQYGSVTYQGFFDGCIVQQVNELASVRGQFRPAVVGGYFGFNVNLDVQFRFL